MGPNDAISDPGGIQRRRPPRVDKENPVRPDCRWSPRMERTRLRLPRVYAHVNPDSRTSFHKFLPVDVLPRITARRFTAKPRVGKIVFTASGYIHMGVTKTKRREARETSPRGRRVRDAGSDRNDFSMGVFVSRPFEISLSPALAETRRLLPVAPLLNP